MVVPRGAPTEGRLRAGCRRGGSAGDPAGTSARRELSLGPKGLTFPRRVLPGAGATGGGRLMVVPRGAPTEGRLRAKCRRGGSAGDPAGTSARRELSLGPKGLTYPRRVRPGAGATVGGRLGVVPRCAPTEGRLQAKCRREASAGDSSGTSARREHSLRPKGLTWFRRVRPREGTTEQGGCFYAARGRWTARLLKVEGLAATRA